jgi:hypothetical protein
MPKKILTCLDLCQRTRTADMGFSITTRASLLPLTSVGMRIWGVTRLEELSMPHRLNNIEGRHSSHRIAAFRRISRMRANRC